MKYWLSKYDIVRFYEEKKKTYFLSLGVFILGIIIGVIIAISSDRIMSLLKTEDKVLFDFINGKVTFSKQIFKLFRKFINPLIIIFLLCLTPATSGLSFVYFGYLGAMFFLNSYALITEFAFSGILSFVLLGLPVNIVLIASQIFFHEMCFSRCRLSKKYKDFKFGFNDAFFLKLIILLLAGIIFCVAITLILILVLKNYVFVIF